MGVCERHKEGILPGTKRRQVSVVMESVFGNLDWGAARHTGAAVTNEHSGSVEGGGNRLGGSWDGRGKGGVGVRKWPVPELQTLGRKRRWCLCDYLRRIAQDEAMIFTDDDWQ